MRAVNDEAAADFETSTEVQTNPLGVMHKAIIVAPSESESRIINSTMLVAEGDEIDPKQVEEFVVTEKVSKKAY